MLDNSGSQFEDIAAEFRLPVSDIISFILKDRYIH